MTDEERVAKIAQQAYLRGVESACEMFDEKLSKVIVIAYELGKDGATVWLAGRDSYTSPTTFTGRIERAYMHAVQCIAESYAQGWML